MVVNGACPETSLCIVLVVLSSILYDTAPAFRIANQPADCRSRSKICNDATGVALSCLLSTNVSTCKCEIMHRRHALS